MYTLETHVPVAELDPFAELRPSAFLRLLQITASRASVALGYDASWYANEGTTWIVRSTHLTIRAPLYHDDDLAIRTWVSDFRRVRSLRRYEILRAKEDQPIAQATTDWVYARKQTATPITPPEELQKAFMPTGVRSEARRPRIRLSQECAASIPLRPVEYTDLDSLRHTNNSRYVDFIQQAIYTMLTDAGYGPDFNSNEHLRLYEVDIEYLSPSLYGEMLSARVGDIHAEDRGLSATVAIDSNRTPAACARTRWQWSGQSIPAELATVLENLQQKETGTS